MTEAPTGERSRRAEMIPAAIGLVVAVVAALLFAPRPAPASGGVSLEPTTTVFGTTDEPAGMDAVLDGPLRVKVGQPEWVGSTLLVLVHVANSTDRPLPVRPTDFEATNPITGAAYAPVKGAPVTDPLPNVTLGPGQVVYGQLGFAAPSAGVDALIIDRGTSPPHVWDTLGP